MIGKQLIFPSGFGSVILVEWPSVGGLYGGSGRRPVGINRYHSHWNFIIQMMTGVGKGRKPNARALIETIRGMTLPMTRQF
jgi:hypothetical protein